VRRLLALWLTLLGADWLAGTVVTAMTSGRVDSGPQELARLALVPVLQTAVIAWVTRRGRRDPPPG